VKATSVSVRLRIFLFAFKIPNNNHTVGALSLVRLVLATLTRAFIPDALLDLANLAAPRRSGDLTASTSASTLPFLPRLPRLRHRPSSTMVLIALTSTSPPPTTIASTRLSVITMAPLVCLQLHWHVIRSQLRRPRPSSARLLRPQLLHLYARLPRHRHKGLSPRTHRLLLQPQHTRRIDCYDYGGCYLLASSLVLPSVTLPLWLRGDVRVNRNSTILCTHIRC